MITTRSLSACLVLAAWAVGATTFGVPAAAQSDPAGGDPQMRALIKELKSELQRGERERLIDPWYLRDLRNLIGRYENPWDTRLFSDDFSGQGPQPNPPWQVTAGEFLIDWRHGLRSVVEPPPAAAQPQQQERAKSSEKDQLKKLFGEVLKQALTDKQGAQQTTQEPQQAAQGPGYAAAIAPVRISNAFALRIDMTSRSITGMEQPRFEIGPYQGANAAAGYRLAISPKAKAGTPSLELLRLSARGTISTLELTDTPLTLQDGKVHVIEWTRDPNGRMAVKVDGTELMSVTDRSFRDAFDGIALVNSGGDYALRSLTVDGTS